MLKSFFAAIIALLVVTFGLHHSPVAIAPISAARFADTRSTQVAAADTPQQQYPATASTSPLYPPTPKQAGTTPQLQDLSSSGPSASPTIPTNPNGVSITGTPITRTVGAAFAAQLGNPLLAYATIGDLASTTDALQSEIAALANPVVAAQFPQQVAAGGSGNPFVAASEPIGSLTNVTVNGVSGLTASEIPDLSGTYLPLSGGTVSGNLNVTGSFSGGSLSLSAASSTNASSTNLFSTNAVLSDATSTNLFSTLANFGTAIATTFNASVANIVDLTATNATTTNLVATNATSTNLAVTGTASTSALVASNSLTLPTSFSGVLHAVAGVVSASLVNLASDVSGILPVGNGGTGWANINSGSLLFGNGASTLATSSNLFWDNTHSYLGVGTSTPGSLLSLGGIANFTDATSTLYSTGGINLTAGCFSINGTCVTGGGGGASLSGGTAGMLAAWTSGSSLTATSTPTVASIAATSTTATSSFAGAISIGNGTGQFTLSMKDAGSGTDTFSVPTFRSTLANSVTAMDIVPNGAPSAVGNHLAWNDICDTDILGKDGSQQTQCLDLAAGSSAIYVGALAYGVTPTKPLVFLYGSWPGTQAMEINTSGEVGIGTSYAPTQLFDVNGSLGVTSGGRIGVGSSTPYVNGGELDILHDSAFLSGTTENAGITIGSSDVQGSSAGPELLVGVDSAHNAAYVQSAKRASNFTSVPLVLNAIGGNVGIGTTSPSAPLTVWGPNTASTTAFNVVNSASTTVFAVYDSGNATYSGSIFQSSDERLKTDVQSLDASSSLSLLEQLNPVSYLRLDQPGGGENLGFLAQQVGGVFPELVSTTSPTALTPDGTLTLNYEGLIAPIVGAIQALAADVSSLEQTVAGFAESLTSNQLTATNELCVGSTCVTPAQFQAMVAASGQAEGGSQSDSGGSTPPVGVAATNTPPVIQINGDNPATVEVGTTYSDLGATITGPQADLNLGLEASVDGGATTTPDQIQIDTTQPGTHTILYSATDQNGLTGYATRTVIVVASAASDDDATTTATTATTTATAP